MRTLYRIIDKETKIFKRDDFECDDTEKMIAVECPQGMSKPKWQVTEIIGEDESVQLLGEWVDAMSGGVGE